MFTDDQVTPLRIETLLELLFEMAPNYPTREQTSELLQPEGLPGLKQSRGASLETIKAAFELGIIEERERGLVPTAQIRSRPAGRSVRDIVRTALEEKVLAGTQVEPWLALFYSYLLGLNRDGAIHRDHQDWADAFNAELFNGVTPSNPLNKSKLEKLRRWFLYMGLGWTDPANIFQCNPTPRLTRALGGVFGTDSALEIDEFMTRLGRVCPELDGGRIFLQANPSYDKTRRVCSLGLGRALVEMHEAGTVNLQCPPDSHGWSIELAEPTRDPHIRSERISLIELPRRAKAKRAE